MSQSAYIQLVQGSTVDQITLDNVLEVLDRYRSQTALTGQQLSWNYAEMAFPYTIERRSEGSAEWLYLKGNQPNYRYILIGVGTRQEEERSVPYIQIVLPNGATHGDKSKANELCKYIGRLLKAEVRLFNGRVMYFNPRK
jgi:hypothetical protein